MVASIIYYFFSYFVVALALALVLVPMMRPISYRFSAVDKGTGRRVHEGIIPRLGGIGIYLSFIIPVTFSLTRGVWEPFHDKMVGVLLGATIIFLTGVYDDIKGARIRAKLTIEVLAALLIYFWGIRITIVSNPFGAPFVLGWLSLPATVLWIIVITNSINLIDGLDGLAAGTVIVISATLFSLAGQDVHLHLVYVVLAGSLLGFLKYNFPPASIFMGDSGSLFLGFFLGATSVLSSSKATAMATMMVPIIAFSFPLLDMFYAVMRRYLRGIALGEADREHIHHKLLDKGFTKKKALLTLYALNVGLLLLVLLFVRKQLNVDFWGLVLIVVLTIAGVKLLGYVEFIPFLKERVKKYGAARKRRYYDYVVLRFRSNAAKSRSLDDLKMHLTALLREYSFSSVEIVLNTPNVSHPFYSFHSGTGGGGEVKLSFPVTAKGREPLGEIHMSKPMDTDHFVFTSALLRALSEEVGRFVKEEVNPGNPYTERTE
jgi:UDP-GlcNAc:undecaprenyl-phosphate/decaprenyl-phosphate GlcNAc-1-phosphate transferase